MKTNRQVARRAGFYYLLMAVFGVFGMLYVSSDILVEGDAMATLRNIEMKETMYRLGIISNVLCQVAFVFLAVELYRLFKTTNQWLSKVLFSLIVVAVPIAIFNEINRIGVLYSLSVGAEMNQMALLFQHLHEQGIVLVDIFWGLWLLPFGVLILQSHYLPKIIGYLLLIGGVSYLIEWSTQLLIADGINWVSQFLIYASVGEFATMIYLTVWGVRKSKIQPVSIN